MFYGFDVGGTKIEFGAFDLGLERLVTQRIATPHDDYQALLQAIVDRVLAADRQFNTLGKVGIGIPGMLNSHDDTVFTANIPASMGKPLKRDLEQRLNRPVRIDNDANCFALSEAWDGDFRRYPSVLGIILGTGMGAGLIINGQPYSGKNGVAGELGHLRLPVDALDWIGADVPRVRCGCGHDGCMENYISGRGFEWLYQYYYQQPLSAPEVIRRYEQGDATAGEFVERFVTLLAICLGNILTLFDPHLVVLGGGLSNFNGLYTTLPDKITPHLLRAASVPPIYPARWGDSGGVRGAAFLNLLD